MSLPQNPGDVVGVDIGQSQVVDVELDERGLAGAVRPRDDDEARRALSGGGAQPSGSSGSPE